MLTWPKKESWKKAGILILEKKDYRRFVFYGPKHAKALGHNTEGKIRKCIVDIYNV